MAEFSFSGFSAGMFRVAGWPGSNLMTLRSACCEAKRGAAPFFSYKEVIAYALQP